MSCLSWLSTCSLEGMISICRVILVRVQQLHSYQSCWPLQTVHLSNAHEASQCVDLWYKQRTLWQPCRRDDHAFPTLRSCSLKLRKSQYAQGIVSTLPHSGFLQHKRVCIIVLAYMRMPMWSIVHTDYFALSSRLYQNARCSLPLFFPSPTVLEVCVFLMWDYISQLALQVM